MIAAMARNGVIGAGGSLPWHLPADMRHFVRTTRGKPVVMGRRNYEDIGGPLPKRRNIVISRNKDYEAPGCYVVTTPSEAIQAADDAEEIMVIGGQQIYEAFLPHSDRLYLTYVDTAIEGDTFFPPIIEAEWRVMEHRNQTADDDNPYPMEFVTLERRACR